MKRMSFVALTVAFLVASAKFRAFPSPNPAPPRPFPTTAMTEKEMILPPLVTLAVRRIFRKKTKVEREKKKRKKKLKIKKAKKKVKSKEKRIEDYIDYTAGNGRLEVILITRRRRTLSREFPFGSLQEEKKKRKKKKRKLDYNLNPLNSKIKII